MVDLEVEFAGMRFKNPVAAAAGPITSTPYTLKRCIEAGVGSVTVKSVGLDPLTQFLPRPGNWFCDRLGDRGSLMHCFAGILPLEKALENIRKVKPVAEREGSRLIGSFFFMGEWTGLPPFEEIDEPIEGTLREMGLELQDAGAEAIELAMTCGLSMTASETELFLREAIPAVYRAFDGHLEVPFWLKIGFTHDVFLLRDIAVLRELGATAMHTYSDFRVTFLDIETGRPPLPVPFGYGRWLRGPGNYAAYLSSNDTGLQVISSGGIWKWEDAVERMMCGATMAAIESAVQYRGYKVFEDVIEGMTRFMERKGYEKATDMIGTAAPHIDNLEEFVVQFMSGVVPPESLQLVLSEEKCNGCGRCGSCIYGAVAINNGMPTIDLEMCERCGACISICPVEALSIVPAA